MIAMLLIFFWLLTAVFIAWFLVNLLEPLTTGLDKLVGVLDHFRKVIFNSQMDVIQLRKSDRLADLDVDIAHAKFDHDSQRAAIELELLKQQGRLMITAQREAMKSEVGQ